MSIGRALVQAGLLGAMLPEGAAAAPAEAAPVTIGRIARDAALDAAFAAEPAAALRAMGIDPAAYDLANPLAMGEEAPPAADAGIGEAGAIQLVVYGPPPTPPMPGPSPSPAPSPRRSKNIHVAVGHPHSHPPAPHPSPTASPDPGPMPVYGPPPSPYGPRP